MKILICSRVFSFNFAQFISLIFSMCTCKKSSIYVFTHTSTFTNNRFTYYIFLWALHSTTIVSSIPSPSCYSLYSRRIQTFGSNGFYFSALLKLSFPDGLFFLRPPPWDIGSCSCLTL